MSRAMQGVGVLRLRGAALRLPRSAQWDRFGDWFAGAEVSSARLLPHYCFGTFLRDYPIVIPPMFH